MNLKTTLRAASKGWRGGPPADLLPELPPQPHINRCIHQIFFSEHADTLPPELERTVAHIRHINPGWQHRLYGAEDMVAFIRRHYGERVLAYFQRINPVYGAARADLFRYLLLYRAGGLYLDIKSTLRRPLDEVLRADDRYLLSHWHNKPGQEFERWGLHAEIAAAEGEFQQWHIVAAAGHPFLRAVIERVLRNIAHYNPALDGTGWMGVMRTTGPIAYTLAIAPLLSLHPHRIVDAQVELGFQYSIYPRSLGSAAHQGLFRSHYTQLEQPVVCLSTADKLLSWSLTAARATKARLRKGA